MAGRSMNRIDVFELLPPESLLDSDQQQSLLYSSDLDLGETTKQIFEAVERRGPPGGSGQSFPKSGCWRKVRCAIGANPRDQALFRQVQSRPDARRPDGRTR
jgi:hypothetical protein